MDDRPTFPTAHDLRKMISSHVSATAGKCLAIIGQRLWDLQWSGQICFHDLPFAEDADKERLIVSRMGEKDVRRVVDLIQDRLDECGYDYDFDVQKYDEHPHFRIYYYIDLQEGEEDASDDGSSASGGPGREASEHELEPQPAGFSALDLLQLTPSEEGSFRSGEDEGPRTQESPIDLFFDD